jgi:hypothetical protein
MYENVLKLEIKYNTISSNVLIHMIQFCNNLFELLKIAIKTKNELNEISRNRLQSMDYYLIGLNNINENICIICNEIIDRDLVNKIFSEGINYKDLPDEIHSNPKFSFVKKEFIYSKRHSYIELLEGCKYSTGHIEHYLFDELLVKEICTFIQEY